jgi:hypothetical protein
MSLRFYFLFPLRIEMNMEIPNFIDLSLEKAKAIPNPLSCLDKKFAV